MRRTELVRVLANLDQILAETEEIAADSNDQDCQSALDFLIELQESRRIVEVGLRGE